MQGFRVVLSKFEVSRPREAAVRAADRKARMEFHICREVRDEHGLDGDLFSLTGNVILADMRQVRALTVRLNAGVDAARNPERFISAAQLNAMGLIDEILHYIVALYREQVQPDVFETALGRLEGNLGSGKTRNLLESFCGRFPPRDVYGGKTDVAGYLAASDGGESCVFLSLEELLLLAMANLNPAFRSFLFLFDDSTLAKETVYPGAIDELKAHLAALPAFGPDGLNLWDLLRQPALASPDSLFGQLDFMRKKWGLILGRFMGRLLTSLDVIKEEEKPSFFGPGPTQVLDFRAFENEYERFTPDQEWMPRTVLIAKSSLVWLFQLSQKYGRELTRLDQIPDEELDELARRGFTGLWLIGLWERSRASKTIKQWTGNPEAAASAYSLYDYDIAWELGGWGALANLRARCMRRGIRLGSDMVPNHTGLDSRWIVEHPERFLQLPYPPFPTYNYSCENLSGRDDITVQIEDHYFSRSDAAVVFRRIDNRTGETRFIYHGNDGTSMPWNDTAQIDFLNAEAREAVIRTIIGVCQQFPIVRFDAAMTLAKRHIQRLWFPAPGQGGAIASRAEHAITTEEFNRLIPEEFWREVVDRCAVEAPHTLLLAEAFWMMEGYFVRTLGMHRVYNSAFMNMLKNEENSKYRATIKNTLEFDPEVLKRFVNFMNNPDEETAVAQFGKGDKYFGICTLLVTMPGLPMFGHGQIEGFEEKYGMEYRRSYRDETPDWDMVNRHEWEIFPLMKKRHVFSGSADFCLYDFYDTNGNVNENVFAYSNRAGDERALIFYNNSYYQTSGWIRMGAVAIPQKDGSTRQDSLCEAMSLHGENRYFTIFREQRSGLWYVRSSKAIAEQGLFAGLSGYEAQVFLDIQEKEDAVDAPSGTWEARWSMLNHFLGGRGVRNLDEALLDIFLGELYAPFREILSPKCLETPDKAVKIGLTDLKIAFLTTIDHANIFSSAAEKYLDGGNGKYIPWIGNYPKQEENEPADSVYEWTSPAEKLESLADEVSTGKAAKKTAKFLEGLKEKIAGQPALALMFLGYNALALLRTVITGTGAEAAALARHWQLDRILRERWENAGIPGDEAHRAVEIALAVLARTKQATAGVFTEAKTPELIAAAIILENYNADDFRKLLGVNRFEDVTWFNKEAFEETLFLSSLFLSIEEARAFGEKTGKPEMWRKRIDTIAAIVEAFSLAEKASGYRFDKLTEVLSREKPATQKTGTKKPAAAKTGTKKPVAKKPGTEKPTKQKSGSAGKKEPVTDKSVAEKPTKQKSGSPGTPRAKGKK
ncbi:MAG: alpha-amylase [Treponema sp.]|nr:alpha-amylase [Treponema sp.]